MLYRDPSLAILTRIVAVDPAGEPIRCSPEPSFEAHIFLELTENGEFAATAYIPSATAVRSAARSAPILRLPMCAFRRLRPSLVARRVLFHRLKLISTSI